MTTSNSRTSAIRVLSTYIRIRREKVGLDQPCDDCGTPTKSRDLYYVNANGKPLTMPLCKQCFEDAMRRLTRETIGSDPKRSDDKAD